MLVRPPTLDLNADGVLDAVRRSPGWNPVEPVFGRVEIRSGTGGISPLRHWVGQEPDNHFGYAACLIPDRDGDAMPDLAVCAPTATQLADP